MAVRQAERRCAMCMRALLLLVACTCLLAVHCGDWQGGKQATYSTLHRGTTNPDPLERSCKIIFAQTSSGILLQFEIDATAGLRS